MRCDRWSEDTVHRASFQVMDPQPGARQPRLKISGDTVNKARLKKAHFYRHRKSNCPRRMSWRLDFPRPCREVPDRSVTDRPPLLVSLKAAHVSARQDVTSTPNSTGKSICLIITSPCSPRLGLPMEPPTSVLLTQGSLLTVFKTKSLIML